MKFIPILFSTEMVRAIGAGRKTKTRRVVSIDKSPLDCADIFQIKDDGFWQKEHIGKFSWATKDGEFFNFSPYGKPGDILWVRETFCVSNLTEAIIYKASKLRNVQKLIKWKPSIFMTKRACRLFLKIKSIGVERLNVITEADALSEGVFYDRVLGCYAVGDHIAEDTAVGTFKALWCEINGKKSWDANPWVWVIEFEQIELTKEERELFLSKKK